MADANLINADRLLGKNMKLNSNSNEEAAGPKVLDLSYTSQEQFKDSVPGGCGITSTVGMGTYLTGSFESKYGIETYHHTGVYDPGKWQTGPQQSISACGTGCVEDIKR